MITDFVSTDDMSDTLFWNSLVTMVTVLQYLPIKTIYSGHRMNKVYCRN